MMKQEAPALHNLRKPKKKWSYFFMIMPLVVFLILFAYIPLFGWYLAFIEYRVGRPIFECTFVGWANFQSVFSSSGFTRAFGNTVIFSALKYVCNILPPIFAILLNEINNRHFRKTIQTASTLPHFISWVIMYSLCYALFTTDGPVNKVLALFGTSQRLLLDKNAVYAFHTCLDEWKGLGWSAIIYIAAITGIDQEQYEAASIDGAGYFRKALHITIPGILPTAFVVLLLALADILNNGMQHYYVFQNSVVYNKLETLELYTYKQGIQLTDYSYATALGIAMSAISLTLLFVTNFLAKKVRGNSIV